MAETIHVGSVITAAAEEAQKVYNYIEESIAAGASAADLRNAIALHGALMSAKDVLDKALERGEPCRHFDVRLGDDTTA